MLSKEATPEMVAAWRSVYAAHRARLAPNRKTGKQIFAYLKGKYPVCEVREEEWAQVVTDNVLLNEWNRKKLPAGKKPKAAVFQIQNAGAGKELYQEQDELFKGQDIFAGIELETGFFLVEGSSKLWDELFCFRGLDETDLDNFYLVAEYVSCQKRLGLLCEE